MRNENETTRTARRRFDRISPIYDAVEGLVERSRFSGWRQLLWSKVEGNRILEVGVGTGKNFSYYPENAEIDAIDFSAGMLGRARRKAEQRHVGVHLQQMDVQNLEFEDDAFDSVVGTFVFCSVPDPVLGLMEIRRVCKPGGKVILVEHVLSANRVLAWAMNLVNPVVARSMGPNINRRTVENVSESGLVIEQVTDLFGSVFKLIEARRDG